MKVLPRTTRYRKEKLYCHACGVCKDAIDLVRKVKLIDFARAEQFLARWVGEDQPRTRKVFPIHAFCKDIDMVLIAATEDREVFYLAEEDAIFLPLLSKDVYSNGLKWQGWQALQHRRSARWNDPYPYLLRWLHDKWEEAIANPCCYDHAKILNSEVWEVPGGDAVEDFQECVCSKCGRHLRQVCRQIEEAGRRLHGGQSRLVRASWL